MGVDFTSIGNFSFSSLLLLCLFLVFSIIFQTLFVGVHAVKMSNLFFQLEDSELYVDDEEAQQRLEEHF